MLASSLTYAVVQFAASSGSLLDATSRIKPGPNGIPLAPGEPPTLILALIGISLVGIYIATRRIRPQQDVRRISTPTAQANDAAVETPTRGAA
ncbi:MAG TPA: hypothetical protein VHE81_14425 [Lacipirellulaceae bacterium]|nr:hypothetical protein [Lacipirellulaceae bacterium]